MKPDAPLNYYSEIFANPVNAKLYYALKSPLLRLRDAGVSSRVFSHWKESGLLPRTPEGEPGWNKFNFSEFIWLKIIQQLREFGVPLNTILKAKEILLEEMKVDWSTSITNEVVEAAKKKIRELEFQQHEKDMFDKLFESGKISEIIQDEKITFTVLEGIICNSLIFSQEAGLILYSNGKIIPWMDGFFLVKGTDKLFDKSHIYISITNLFIEFLSDKSKEKFISLYSILSNEELEVLRRIREKDLLEVVIKFPKESNKQKMDIVTKKNVGLTKEQQEEVCRILSLKNYQSITLKSQGDGKLYVEKTHRKKL